MSSKIQTGKTMKKNVSCKKQVVLPTKEVLRGKPHMKIHHEDETDSDESSLNDKFPIDYSSGGTDDTDDTSSSNISQEFSDEDKLMKYYETKVRGNGLFEPASDDSSDGSDLPRRLKEMMNGFRKQNSQSQQDRNIIPGKLSPEHASKKPVGHRRVDTYKPVLTKNVLKHTQKRNDKSSSEYNKIGKKKISKVDKRIPLKDEAAFQKSSLGSFSNYSRSSEWKNKPEESRKPKEGETLISSSHQKPTRNPMIGLAENRQKSTLEKVVRGDTKDRRNKIIEYLCQIDDAEKALQSRSKEENESSEAVDTITSRDALLRKHGFELTSKDELLKLGGAADKKRRREKRRLLFPSSSSSSSGSDASMDENEVKSTLKSFLGRKGSDVDVSEHIRHGRKWRNCVEDGECQCRPRTEKENERINEDQNKKKQQFLNIFDGKDPPHHDYTREDLLKAHEKIGPWVHEKTKRLDKFIESGKYSPQYLLNIWDGRLSGDSSDDEPNFDKYREEYKKKQTAQAQEDGPPIPPEDRVPTLEENNWFLFPTPMTRMYGIGETASPRKPNSRAAMEAIASDLRRKREIDRAKEYLDQRTFPEPHLYPRPIDLTKQETTAQIRHPLLGMFPPSQTKK